MTTNDKLQAEGQEPKELSYYSPTGEQITQAEWHQLKYGYPLGEFPDSYDKLRETIETKGLKTPSWSTKVSDMTTVITRYEGEGHAWHSYIYVEGSLEPRLFSSCTIARNYADNAEKAESNHVRMVQWLNAERGVIGNPPPYYSAVSPEGV